MLTANDSLMTPSTFKMFSYTVVITKKSKLNAFPEEGGRGGGGKSLLQTFFRLRKPYGLRKIMI